MKKEMIQGGNRKMSDGCLNCNKRDMCKSYKEIGHKNYKFGCYEKENLNLIVTTKFEMLGRVVEF